MTETVTPQADLEARWLPADTAVAHAKTLLAAEPAADMAVIPMWQPGKQRGVWVTGQEVRTIHGVVILAANRFGDPEPGDPPIPPYTWARATAEDIAAQARAAGWKNRTATWPGRPGTTGYGVVHRGGNVSVFEGYL